MRIDKALIWAKEELKDIKEGENDALFLLSYITARDKAMLIAFAKDDLSDDELRRFGIVIGERKKQVPISQILGTQPFWRWDFKISDDVLTPRADSEVLIEAMLNNFSDHSQAYNIADFGTGSGCLLLSALSEYPNAQGYGVDMSKKALDIAKQNKVYINKQGVEFKSPMWVQGSWVVLKKYAPFDIILANPPYIAESEKANLTAEVLNHDPPQALFAEDNGLKAYKELFPLFKEVLAPNGCAYVEHGYQQQDILVGLAKEFGLRVIRRLPDLSNHPRGLVLSI